MFHKISSIAMFSPSLPLPVLYPEPQKSKMIHKYKWWNWPAAILLVKIDRSSLHTSDSSQQLYVQKRTTRLDVFLKTMKKYYVLTRISYHTSTEVDVFLWYIWINIVIYMAKYGIMHWWKTFSSRNTKIQKKI